ncbi:MAG: hypothetical protein V4608_06100 [Bacteroidota bacterium]
MTTTGKYIVIAEDTFYKVKEKFPHLTMTLDYNDKNVDLRMDISKQDGLDFDVNLNLQNKDELHISTNFIWCQFFSADSSEVVQKFTDAVTGLIAGDYRVLQFVKINKVYKSFLQRPDKDNWVTVYKHIHKLSFPWTRLEQNVIQNNKASRILNVFEEDSSLSKGD